jgi:ABC-type branched-subunit amino acid transport system substrate-binding protein
VTASTIKLGGYFVLSGPLYDLAGKDPFRVWQSAVRYFNDAGGVNGRKYVPDPIQAEIDCGPGMANLRKAVEQDKIFMLAGSFDPYLTPCAGQYLDNQGVPNLASDGIDPKVLTFKTTFPMGTTHYRYARIASKWVTEQLHANSVTLITHSDPLFDSVVTGAREILGGRLKSVERMAYDEGNLAPLVQRVRSAGADVLLPYVNPDRMILLMQEMERQGYKPPKGIHGVASTVLDLIPRSVGQFAEGLQGESWIGVADSPGPGVQDMVRVVGRYAPNTTIDLYSAGGFAGVRLATQVIQSLGSNVTRQRFIDAMNQLTNFDNAGLQPPLTYRKGQHEANRCMQILQVSGGKWRFLHNWICDQ